MHCVKYASLSNLFRTSLYSSSSCLRSVSRSTVILRSGRVTLLAPRTIAAKRCRSSPAHYAKTSTFSPSTSPSIDTCKCVHAHTHAHTHTEHSLQKARTVNFTPITATHLHIPPLQIHIQQEDSFIHISCVNTASSDMHNPTHARARTHILERTLMLIYMFSELSDVLANNLLKHLCVCVYAS